MPAPTTPTTTRREKCSACGGYFASEKTLKAHWTKTAACFQVIKNHTQATLTTPTAQTANQPEQPDVTSTLGPSSSTPATPTTSRSNPGPTLTSIIDRDPGFCMLLPEAYHFFIDTKPCFSLSKPGPPRDPPTPPTTSADITMIHIGYVIDTADDYLRGKVTVKRAGLKAYARLVLNGTNPGLDHEYVDETGTRVKISDVWLSKRYSQNADDGNPSILDDVQDAYVKHLAWLDNATTSYQMEYNKWKKERLEWEAALAINLAYNNEGRWKLRSAPGRILALGDITPTNNVTLTHEVFQRIKDQLIQQASDPNSITVTDTNREMATFEI